MLNRVAMITPSPLRSAAAQPLTGETRVPGDKSISHRSLMLAAVAVGTTTIDGLLEGEDVLNTAHAVAAMGAAARRLGSGRWEVDGVGVGALAEPADVLDLGNSGTGARLLSGLIAGHPITAVLTGDASLRRRPMNRIVAPLTQFGARFETRSGGRLPMTIVGARDPVPVVYRLPVPSAQVKSAVLLAALNAPGATTVIEPEPTRDHSELMLRHFGAEVTVVDRADGRAITLIGQPELKARAVRVPGDPSSAAFFAVAALLVPGSKLTLTEVGINPLRTGLYATLKEMGADIRFLNQRVEAGEPVADIEINHSPLVGVEVPAARAPSMIDEYPILAVAAAFAKGPTVMRGLAELRVKESDRLAAIADGLAAQGVTIAMEEDSLIVQGGGGGPCAGGGTVATSMDHRVAMAFLLLGLAPPPPVTVDDGRMIATSFPGFVEIANRLGAAISPALP
jgi:3-phosphoshikimate 1-carboxyvinyltransferase